MNKSEEAIYFYMDISLDFFEEYGFKSIPMDINIFRYVISSALKRCMMSCSIPVEILQYREKDRRGIIRIPSKETVKTWSALVLFSSYDNLECMFRVYKASPLLPCLNLCSSLYIHKKKDKECTERIPKK
ncbi:ribonuclease P [Caerostris darwini]|uniref:Ribonuclease P n=1 Tax=Caerostris darwini TaxID=1538125 RepID=A0AAV4WNQ7_9ARAC|nr:ribonuclease P [Caerostris darwini]